MPYLFVLLSLTKIKDDTCLLMDGSYGVCVYTVQWILSRWCLIGKKTKEENKMCLNESSEILTILVPLIFVPRALLGPEGL